MTSTRTSGVKSTPAKAAKSVQVVEGLNDLLEVVKELKLLEVQNQEASGRKYNYIKICSGTESWAQKKNPDYIKGAERGAYVIPSLGLCLGDTVSVTVYGSFLLYADTVAGEQTEAQKKSGVKPMPRTVGFWMPGDAEQIEVEGRFSRPYVSGNGEEHVLEPQHWCFLRLDDYPDVDDVLLVFRSKGNSIHREMRKLINTAASTTSEVRLAMTVQTIRDKTYNQDYLYPEFQVEGKNFELTDDGITPVKGGYSADDIRTVVLRSRELNKEYAECKMVAKQQNLKSIVGVTQKQITEKTAYDVDEEDAAERPPKF